MGEVIFLWAIGLLALTILKSWDRILRAKRAYPAASCSLPSPNSKSNEAEKLKRAA